MRFKQKMMYVFSVSEIWLLLCDIFNVTHNLHDTLPSKVFALILIQNMRVYEFVCVCACVRFVYVVSIYLPSIKNY